MKRNCLSYALATLVAAIGLPTWASAATINVQGILPLNRTSDNAPTYVSTTAEPATFTEPDNLLVNKYLRTGTSPTSDTRGVYGPRNNGHSFTINATEFPYGIHLDAIAINFEGRGNAATPEDKFDFRVFRVADAFANLPNPLPTDDILASEVGLQLPTLTELGVSDPVSGTAILSFNTPLYLEPGAYGFQFLPKWDNQGGGFGWNRSPISNSDGRRWESGTAGSGTANNTYAFGLVGTVAVPEPASVMLLGMAGVSLALLRRRK